MLARFVERAAHWVYLFNPNSREFGGRASMISLSLNKSFGTQNRPEATSSYFILHFSRRNCYSMRRPVDASSRYKDNFSGRVDTRQFLRKSGSDWNSGHRSNFLSADSPGSSYIAAVLESRYGTGSNFRGDPNTNLSASIVLAATRSFTRHTAYRFTKLPSELTHLLRHLVSRW